MEVGEGPTEVVVEQCSELDQSAAHHLGRWLKYRFLGPPPEMLAYLGRGLGICILTSASGNSHGKHWPQSIWEFSPTLRFLEKETICAPDQDQSVTQELLAFPLRWGSQSDKDGTLKGRLSGLPTCP